MATVKNLIDYLPLYMQEYDEIERIMEAEQSECDNAYEGLELVWNNQFLFSATDEGLKRWEKMLGVTPKADDTFQERRFRIYALLNQELPYTYNKLAETLTTLCGTSDWQVDLNTSSCTVDVKLGISNHKNMATVQEILKKMIPANMVVTITLLCNPHELLYDFTHNQLSEYTHDYLRRGSINNA